MEFKIVNQTPEGVEVELDEEMDTFIRNHVSSMNPNADEEELERLVNVFIQDAILKSSEAAVNIPEFAKTDKMKSESDNG